MTAKDGGKAGLPAEALVKLAASGRDALETWEEMLALGWSDGLPTIPPTPERVETMLAGRDPRSMGASLGAPVYGAAPISPNLAQVAANAVMAGCAPQYFPALLAALDAMGGSGGASTFIGSGAAPLLIFNGPIRQELGIACGHEMLSMTTRANATIGRAIRLLLMNVLDARPPRLFDVQFGMPGRASMVFGENEEESPWESLAASLGVPAGASSVTVFAATGTAPINYHQAPQRASEVQLIIDRCMDYVRGNRIGPAPDAGSPIIVLSPKHVRAFSLEGWSKAKLEDELTAAVNDHYDIELEAHRDKIKLINQGLDPDDEQMSQPKPDGRVRVVIAGGVAGWHSLMIPTLARPGRGEAPVTAIIP